MADRYILMKTLLRSNIESKNESTIKSKTDRKKFNILIVDDDRFSGESLRDLIMYRNRHDVTYIDEGMKFINRLNETSFDLIFMDYHTDEIDPSDDDINGAYFTKLARECYSFNAPVYAYTGDNSIEAIQDFKEAKFEGAFIKPVDHTLINSFFDIIETNDMAYRSKLSKLSKLSAKHRNFIYFS